MPSLARRRFTQTGRLEVGYMEIYDLGLVYSRMKARFSYQLTQRKATADAIMAVVEWGTRRQYSIYLSTTQKPLRRKNPSAICDDRNRKKGERLAWCTISNVKHTISRSRLPDSLFFFGKKDPLIPSTVACTLIVPLQDTLKMWCLWDIGSIWTLQKGKYLLFGCWW